MGYENCGRKPLGWYRDLNDLLNRSYEVIMMALNDESPDGKKLDLQQKSELASRFLVKKVGEKIDLTIEHKYSTGELESMMARIKGYIDTRTSRPSISS